ncbi:LPD7 domain-containing protein [Pseudomonas guariconensis]|uniref:LPD7 domain-containing protein n=1 Tax=Pseudomonas guariconensis TaxID=1288410 RepID=UPI003EDF7828
MKTSDYVFWLAIPHDQKDQAREVAGRLPSGQQAIGYDKESKLWYARPGCDLERLRAWWPDHGRRAEGGDPEVEFSDALTAAGLKVQGLPIMNGKRQRVATIQDKPGKKSGVYCGYLDRFPAGWFINYHTAENEKDVTNWKATGGEADPEARLHIRAAARQNQDDVDRERAALHAERTAAAMSLYGRLPAADPDHGYLQRKGITATDEIRQTRNGALVIPFFNVDGQFKTLQYLTPNGDKFLFEDAPKQGHFYVVGGSLRDGEQILYAEGYATARSLNMATGNPVVMTIDAGNMVTVAKILHARYPKSGHLFLADLDHAKEVNKGLVMATEAAAQVGGQVLHPEFTESEKTAGLTDFNDLHKSRGLEAVFSQVAPLLQWKNEEPTMKDAPQPTQSDVLATNSEIREQLQEEAAQKKLRAKRTPASPAQPRGAIKDIPSPDASAPVVSSYPAAAPAAAEQSLAPDASAPVASSDPAAASAAAEQSPAPDASAPVASSDPAAASAAAEQSAAPDASAPMAGSDPAAARAAAEQSPAPVASAPVASSDPAAASAAAEQSPTPVASAPVAGSDPAAAMQAHSEGMANEDLPAAMPLANPVAVDQTEAVTPDPEVQIQAKHKQPGDVSGQDVQTDTVDSIWVGPPRPRGQEPEPDAGLIDKDALLARITHEMQGDSVLYKLDGEPAFIDRGMRLEMADGASQNDEKVLAALLTAAQYYRGRIELTGSEAFQRKAIGLIAQHQLNVTMKTPAQQLQLEEARKALAAEPLVKDSIAGDAPPTFDASTPLTPVGQAPIALGPEVQARLEPAASTKPAAASASDTDASVVAVNGQAASATITVQPQPVDSSPAAEVSAAHRVGQEVHVSAQMASKGVVGKIVAMGDAPFQFDDKNTGSTYITLRTKTGQQTFWGKELAGIIRDTRVQPGKVVTLQWLGKEPVVVKVPVKDADGKTVRYEDKHTHRNNWSLSMNGNPVVRTGDDIGVKLTAYDVQRFCAVQNEMMARMNLNVPLPTAPNDGLFWLTPDGQGSAKAGDHLMAPRPAQDLKSAGLPVMSSWTAEGHLDMALVRGDGHYLQGVVRHEGQLQHVLVSLPNRDDAPPMVFNLITDAGMVPIGVGNGINRSGGEAVSRENIAFKLNGDTAARIGKLDKPAELPPALHARLGFDERWRDDNTLPKSAPAAAPTAQPSVQRPA